MASVEVSNLSRSFGIYKALDDVSIRFEDGGFYALLGPSGSGKTTLLRMIGGFDYPDQGRIAMNGESVERVPLEKRNIGMVFQSYALFPNMTVFDNVAFGLEIRGVSRQEIKTRVGEALELVQLSALGHRKPNQLSGGQRQRVALARAIVIKPRVLLLDEPLGALDKSLRLDMQVELKRIQREIGVTTIFVTHDQEEALTMSDRIGILSGGRVIEEGAPADIYHRPNTLFAATFLGEANIFEGRWADGAVELQDGVKILAAADAKTGPNGAAAHCLVRPERIAITAPTNPTSGELNRLTGRLTRRLFSGHWTTLFIQRGEQEIRVGLPSSAPMETAEGDEVMLSWAREHTIGLAA
ncbi:ABC transporter ATP-binding protein [Rhizobium sp. FKL33]|uniref:ABC transporter ATP-binding protein n=1 Tax=Rhizobium sp. FKL33 TaxID=2562307 RepID=UPI0010BFC2F7|nr:ABC transporter ATP-binding protein [Rhizobium sp. FKL33]